ncbi:MAG: hypothetical protein QXW63_00035 [Candidatus Bathyarchaeia archaeon]
MNTSLISNLLNFMKTEKIKMRLKKISDSEFWLESPEGSLTTKFAIDDNAHEVFYDVFSTEQDVHLKEETIKDVERIDFIAEEHKEWKLAKAAEDVWLILDRVKLWAQQNNYELKEHEMI